MIGSAGDTIVASASAWGRAAVGLVRLSGPAVPAVLAEVCPRPGGLPPARRAVLVSLRDADGAFDRGLLTWMPGPHSYTGEDCAEVSCHGNPLLVERLLCACTAAGARLAMAGEFTRRAFANGRLDLTRAEAVLQAIEARSARGLEVASRGLQGELAGWLSRRREALLRCGAELELRIDFPDHAEMAGDASVIEALRSLEGELRAAAATHRRARVEIQGGRVALVGPANAGKSSLFNALLGRRRALVDPRPGTTRDVLEVATEIDGLPVVLLDTAGERRRPRGLEREGLGLRDALLAEVDLLVVVLPAHRPRLIESLDLLARTGDRPRVLAGNHADRPGARASIGGCPLLPTCALDGRGLPALRAAVRAALIGEEQGDCAVLVGSRRQHGLLIEAAEALARAAGALAGEAGPAVAAEELLSALAGLDGIAGRGVREEVLDALFARFCIGK